MTHDGCDCHGPGTVASRRRSPWVCYLRGHARAWCWVPSDDEENETFYAGAVLMETGTCMHCGEAFND